MMPEAHTSRAIGIIAPHAGYIYSGKTAGRVYSAITVPDTVVVLCPNHTGLGASAALSPSEGWLTPLGVVPVNNQLSELILHHSPGLKADAGAHQFEHAIEVQLPFLQYRNPNVSIVAICLALPDYPSLAAIGQGIARAISEYGEEVLIVASSDMNHYESAQVARIKDDQALACVAALDPEGLVKVCRDKGITMCGAVAAAVMLVAAKALGATASRLLAYTHSGEVSGDSESVVAYAAVTVS
jgi:AmmeMemoRadiSam system protein B